MGGGGVGRAKVWTDKQRPLSNIRANFTVLTTPQASQEGRRAIKTANIIQWQRVGIMAHQIALQSVFESFIYLAIIYK